MAISRAVLIVPEPVISRRLWRSFAGLSTLLLKIGCEPVYHEDEYAAYSDEDLECDIYDHLSLWMDSHHSCRMPPSSIQATKENDELIVLITIELEFDYIYLTGKAIMKRMHKCIEYVSLEVLGLDRPPRLILAHRKS